MCSRRAYQLALVLLSFEGPAKGGAREAVLCAKDDTLDEYEAVSAPGKQALDPGWGYRV